MSSIKVLVTICHTGLRFDGRLILSSYNHSSSLQFFQISLQKSRIVFFSFQGLLSFLDIIARMVENLLELKMLHTRTGSQRSLPFALLITSIYLRALVHRKPLTFIT